MCEQCEERPYNKLLEKYLPMYREMGIKTPITEKTSTKKTIVSREQQLLEKYLPTYVSLQELRERLDVLKERNNVKEFRTTKESI